MHLGLGKSDGCLKLDCTLPTTIIIGVTVSFLHAPWLPTCSSCIRNASSIFYYTLLLQLQHYIMPIKEGQRWCTLPRGSVSCHKWEMMLPNPITICHVHRDRGCLAPSKWKRKKKKKRKKCRHTISSNTQVRPTTTRQTNTGSGNTNGSQQKK